MDHPGAPAWPNTNHDLTLQYKVHLGVWTDWSRGRVLGATLTLDRQQANLLIAFTASFVVFIGSRFWHIICLFLHQIYSTSDLRDALHHQRQVVLRNSTTSDSGVVSYTCRPLNSPWSSCLTSTLQFKFVALLHAWRRSNFKSIARVVPPLLLAVVCTIGFTIAGGFSSQIELGRDNIGSAVLLDGANCSVITNVTYTMDQLYYEKFSARSISTASNYVQQCYSENSTGLTDCNYFVSQRLPGFVDSAAPCPFKDSLCRSNTTNLALDTGFINTHTHLGLNAPPEERLLIRHKLQCAPLLTEEYSSAHGNYTQYNYGPQWALTSPGSESEGYLNYTYEVESLDNQYTVLDDGTATEQSYMLRSVAFRCVLSGRAPVFTNTCHNVSALPYRVFKHRLLPLLGHSVLTNNAHTDLFSQALSTVPQGPTQLAASCPSRSSSAQTLTSFLCSYPAMVSFSASRCMMIGTEPPSNMQP